MLKEGSSKLEVQLSLTDSIQKRLQDAEQNPLNANDFTISRVMPGIYQGKEMYYEPSVICIGPYHRGKENYQAMEQHKWGQLDDLLKRNLEISVDTFVEKLRILEKQARRCYFEPINMSSDDFVEMLLLDGCFIIEVYLKSWFKHHPVPLTTSMNNISAPISNNSEIIDLIYIDFLLLENQIPFFILQSLFDSLNLREVNVSLMAIVTYCILSVDASASVDNIDIYHLLHLTHHFLLTAPNSQGANAAELSHNSLFLVLKAQLKRLNIGQCCSDQQTNSAFAKTIPCAKKLHEAGITFKKKTSARAFTEISYNAGTLEIPRISLDDINCRLFMNIIAFEQCNIPAKDRLLTCYMSFMDDMIDTPEDVELLQQNGILESYLGSDSETALYFNRIVECAGLNLSDNYLTPVTVEINKHIKSCWPRWRANFKRDFIFSPWAIFSLIAASLLLFFTFIQTFYSVYSYHRYSH